LKFDPLPRSEERGEGVFDCGACGHKWVDPLAMWDVAQFCPGGVEESDIDREIRELNEAIDGAGCGESQGEVGLYKL
jgi:hypothetical protein